MKITVMHSKWGSHKLLAHDLAAALIKRGYEVDVFSKDWHRVKSIDGSFIFISGEHETIGFTNVCQLYKKSALYWIDFFVFAKFIGYKIQERDYRKLGGKLVTCTNTERMHLEKKKITVDGVIPRCIPDEIFNHNWSGTKKEVLSIGFSDYRRENKWWMSFHPPKELDSVTRKGHELLIEFADNNPDWNVKLITGTAELSKAITIPTLSNLDIIEAGSLSVEEKNKTIANTGVFCLPTRLDSCPIVLMEAEAMGVPSCYTALPPLIEMGGGIEIPVKETFWYPSRVPLAIIDYKEVETAIAKTHALGEAISVSGKQNAEKFKASVVAGRLLEVIEK
ncbi:hypothetical protein KAX02_05475 [candidate division WOR-3 bacterium]|nr:hypothetical protein [candidate division WOR-3 bacterium]